MGNFYICLLKATESPVIKEVGRIAAVALSLVICHRLFVAAKDKQQITSHFSQKTFLNNNH